MKATLMRSYYDDIKCSNPIFITQKFKLPLYGFTCIAKDTGKKTVLKYYINLQDLIVCFGDTVRMRCFEQEQNKDINIGLLDYIRFEKKTYLSSTLISKATNLKGWDVDMQELERDIFNATVADEMGYAEAVQDFTSYRVESKSSLCENTQDILARLKENYPFFKDDMLTSIINDVLDVAILNIELPYVPRPVKDPNEETYKDAYEFIRDVIMSYEKSFGNKQSEDDVRAEMDAIEYENYQQQIQEEIDNFEMFDDPDILEAQIPEAQTPENKEIQPVDWDKVNVSYDILSTFISKMQCSAWKDQSLISHYTNSMYIVICSSLNVRYTGGWRNEHSGTDTDPYWYCFRDHKVLNILAKFYISNNGIKNRQFYCKHGGKETPFIDLICDSYDSILDNNIRTFLLKPLGLPTDDNAVLRMKQYIVMRADQEFNTFKANKR